MLCICSSFVLSLMLNLVLNFRDRYIAFMAIFLFSVLTDCLTYFCICLTIFSPVLPAYDKVKVRSIFSSVGSDSVSSTFAYVRLSSSLAFDAAFDAMIYGHNIIT